MPQIDTHPAYYESRSVLRSFLPGEMPAGFGIGLREAQEREMTEPPRKHSDPRLQAILDQIAARQRKSKEFIQNMSPADMAFAIMRNVPRKHWDTPLTELGHWPRGSTIAEIRRNPQLKNYTPKQAIMQLFDLDAQRRRQTAGGR
jgi:hypothetical protein